MTQHKRVKDNFVHTCHKMIQHYGIQKVGHGNTSAGSLSAMGICTYAEQGLGCACARNACMSSCKVLVKMSDLNQNLKRVFQCQIKDKVISMKAMKISGGILKCNSTNS